MVKENIISVLKKLNSGNNKITFEELNIDKQAFGDLIDYMIEKGLIDGTVIRDGNKKVLMVPSNCKITNVGRIYLEENNVINKSK